MELRSFAHVDALNAMSQICHYMWTLSANFVSPKLPLNVVSIQSRSGRNPVELVESCSSLRWEVCFCDHRTLPIPRLKFRHDSSQ
eukprot:2101514-Amphidinium_carterae.1